MYRAWCFAKKGTHTHTNTQCIVNMCVFAFCSQPQRAICRTSAWSWTMTKSPRVWRRSLWCGRRCWELLRGQRSSLTQRPSTLLLHKVCVWLWGMFVLSFFIQHFCPVKCVFVCTSLLTIKALSSSVRFLVSARADRRVISSSPRPQTHQLRSKVHKRTEKATVNWKAALGSK